MDTSNIDYINKMVEEILLDEENHENNQIGFNSKMSDYSTTPIGTNNQKLNYANQENEIRLVVSTLASKFDIRNAKTFEGVKEIAKLEADYQFLKRETNK